MAKFGESGYIQISSEQDRIAIATLLFKNGYQVSTVRAKKDGRSYEYYVKYEKVNGNLTGEEN